MFKLPTLFLATITLITVSAFATSIPINNGNFEVDNVADNAFQTMVPNSWSWTPVIGEGGGVAPNVVDKAAFVAVGINNAHSGDQYLLGHAAPGAQASNVIIGTETSLTWDSLAVGDKLTFSVWATYPNHVDGSPNTGFWLNYPEGQSVGIDSFSRGPGWFNVSSTGSALAGDWIQLAWTYDVTQVDINAAIAGGWGNVSVHFGFLGNAGEDRQVAFDDFKLEYTSTRGPIVKVILQGGQSNCFGAPPNAGLPANLQTPQQDVLFYEYEWAATPRFKNLRPREVGHPSGSEGFGPEVTFGRAVADAYPGESYAIIKHAEPGTALWDDWAPGSGPSYSRFQNTVANGLAALRAAGYTPVVVGMMWHQGESDALEGYQNAYQANLINFIADVRARYNPNLIFLIGEVLLYQASFQTIINAQQAVGNADALASFVPASDLSTPVTDTLHFDAAGQITLGNRFAAAYTALLSGYPAADLDLDGLIDVFDLDDDGDGLSDIREQATGRNPTSHFDMTFQFDSGVINDFDGWTMNADIPAYIIDTNSNFAFLRAEGPAPTVSHEGFSFPGSDIQQLVLAYQSEGVGSFKVYYKTLAYPYYDASRSITLPAYNNANQLVSHIADFSGQSAWTGGTITGIQVHIMPGAPGAGVHTWIHHIIGAAPDTDGDGIVDSLDADDDGDGSLDVFELANGRDPLDVTDLEFAFDNMDAENWQAIHHISALSVNGAGELQLEVGGGSNDPFIVKNDLNFSGDIITSLYIRYRSDSAISAGWPQIFWATSANNTFSGSRVVNPSSQTPDGIWTVAAYDLSGHAEWAGNMISQLRVDINGTTTAAETTWIDVITASNIVPPLSDYEQWKLVHGITTDDGDDDGDGIINSMEYALGSLPNVVDAETYEPKAVSSGSSLSYTFDRKQSSGVTYNIYTSTDLSIWSLYNDAPTDIDLNGITETYTIPIDTDRIFVRLETVVSE